MASQFEKRKAREQKKQKEKTVKLDQQTYDVVRDASGQFVCVVIDYNLETGDAKVVKKIPSNKTVGFNFELKKRALTKLVKI